ncbi:MAG: hypothetical protein ABIN08_01180 [Caldimonas sp.]
MKSRRAGQGPRLSIPDEVRRFVLTSIASVPHLEALLLFHRDPQAWRDGVAVAKALYVTEPKAIGVLEDLHAAALLDVDPGPPMRFRLDPGSVELPEIIRLVALAYANDVVGMTHLIHDAAGKNAMRFAAAFKLKKSDV